MLSQAQRFLAQSAEPQLHYKTKGTPLEEFCIWIFTEETIAEKWVFQPQEVYNKGVQWKNTSAITLLCYWQQPRLASELPGFVHKEWLRNTCSFLSTKILPVVFHVIILCTEPSHTTAPRPDQRLNRGLPIGRLLFRSRE